MSAGLIVQVVYQNAIIEGCWMIFKMGCNKLENMFVTPLNLYSL
ncbi:hypothetical protein UF75_1636 [Desulfosporosinus sp. I2]|nr:hypothetical protein UF75_1636 [Desulfosporosinus sp. I2]